MATGKIDYAASADYTITLASLASDTTLLAGRESTAISNTTNKYKDYLIAGKIRTGTTPTAARIIEVWCYAALKDTPTYPDVLDGTDSAETMTSADIKNVALRLIASIPTDATSDRDYPFGPVSIRSMYGETPTHHGIFVTHSTGVALNATGGNHVISYTPVFDTMV